MVNDNKFIFHIENVFHFENGQTVFVGIVEEGPNLINSREVVLMMGDNVKQTIKLEGEMLPNPSNKDGFRSVSSRDKVNLTRS